ncbi:hypothetical protein CSPX01_07622 [Colletotrichum filicis]|nr:hypothetical protein CSPX01_07622 [Colletotrichum filicis]
MTIHKGLLDRRSAPSPSFSLFLYSAVSRAIPHHHHHQPSSKVPFRPRNGMASRRLSWPIIPKPRGRGAVRCRAGRSPSIACPQRLSFSRVDLPSNPNPSSFFQNGAAIVKFFFSSVCSIACECHSWLGKRASRLGLGS